MKRLFLSLSAGFLALTLLPGCLIVDLEGSKKNSTTCATTNTTTNANVHPAVGQQVTAPTIGQQLIDLQKAKDSGAIADVEYQAQKARLLQDKQVQP